MAWCPHCNQDRPIQRQPLGGPCPHCGQPPFAPHGPNCRGPLPGSLDVCTFCNTPVFAKASDQRAYEIAASLEAEHAGPLQASTANPLPLIQHGATALPPEKTEAIINHLMFGQKIQAIKELRQANPSMGLAQAKEAVEALENQLGLAHTKQTTKGCAAMLLFLLVPTLLTFSYLITHL